MGQIHKSKIKCPICGETENLSIGSYLSGRWSDPPEAGVECYCGPCNKYFYPEKEVNANGRTEPRENPKKERQREGC